MSLSLAQLFVVLLIILLLFGAGKFPQIMSDLAKGLKIFKNNLKSEEDENEKK